MKTILICTACLLMGVLLGRLLPTADRPQDKNGDVKEKSAQASGPVNARMRSRLAKDSSERGGETSPQTEPEFLQSSQGDRLVTVPASLIEKLSLGTGTRTIGQELFSRDGKIEEILKITDREKAAVQTAWRSVREKVRELEARSSTSEDLDDDSVRITIPDLGSRMAAVGEEFQASVENTLGENRADTFMAMKQIDRIFAPPEGERTYEVAVESVGNGRWRYHMTLNGAAGRRVWVAETIPDEIRHLTDSARIVPSVDNPSEGDQE